MEFNILEDLKNLGLTVLYIIFLIVIGFGGYGVAVFLLSDKGFLNIYGILTVALWCGIWGAYVYFNNERIWTEWKDYFKMKN